MKLKLLSLIGCLLLSTSSWALSNDTEQPIYINSNSQSLDMKSNRVTFEGDVTLKQGSINIKADKLIVLRNSEDDSVEVLEAYGKPTTFTQLTDEGKTLSGKANVLKYMVAQDLLTMNGDAELAQDESLIKGTSIRYQIASQQLMADGKEGQPVSTILQPAAPSEPK
ncbi:lipopolysaccharide transport periplasmic protein LptA [Vibrio sp. SCSIO 43136]|uniref:lipopolysaccharide transport periplasmic protein LptA n=1 Tax=Vibrio sp. SCSIO 43136 TaxID=2819101 RepID=UPI002075A6ED|nr:lipopolysaccharide transport periplasmic protein LptA [Vibrio sp. SCSIO 43136]USD64996.1 lipopolysaccharide transport periplasmic protein LptA [Vibrio sp. SCSIO 43136]